MAISAGASLAAAVASLAVTGILGVAAGAMLLAAGATILSLPILLGILAVNLANLLVNTAALPLLAVIAIFTVIDAVTPFAKGGQVKGLAKGGSVQGFARGGSTAGLRDFQKAHNIPKSDTVPAMLTPGEFVLTPDAVKRYGAGFLAALNSGFVDPSAILGMPSATIATGVGVGVMGFAEGGIVSESRTSTASSVRGGAAPIVLPVIAADNTTMQQLTNGGREVFEKDVNRTNITGDPNRSKGWN